MRMLLNWMRAGSFAGQATERGYFAIAPAGSKGEQKTAEAPKQELSTTFAVGEEADVSLPKGRLEKRGRSPRLLAAWMRWCAAGMMCWWKL